MYFLKNSPRFLRLFTLSLAVAFILFVQACKDEDEPRDTTGPEISFTNLTPDMKVRNTVSIKLEALDDFELSTIDIFVGDDLVVTLTEPPYETSWDSNLVPDGRYVVKVVATDKSGNAAEATTSIIVGNTLVTINIAADQLLVGDQFTQRGFVFLSDGNGHLIASTEYTNGNDVALKSPSFDGESFFLTEVITDFEDGVFTWAKAWTWPMIERGADWVVYKGISDDVDYVGEAELVFDHHMPESIYSGGAAGEHINSFDESVQSMTVPLRKSPSMLYLIRDKWSDDAGPLGYGLFNIKTGPNDVIDLVRVYQPLTKITTTVPEGVDYLSVRLYGYPRADDYLESYSVAHTAPGAEPKTLDIYYPGTAFPAYFSSVQMEMPDMSYDRGSFSDLLNLDIPEVNVGMTFAASNLTYSASGDFDFMTTRFYDESGRKSWVLILPRGEDQVVPTLTLPAELEAVSLPGLSQPLSYYTYDFDAINDYESLKNFTRASSRGTDELYDNGRGYLDIEHFLPVTDGRLKKRGKRQHHLKIERR